MELAKLTDELKKLNWSENNLSDSAEIRSSNLPQIQAEELIANINTANPKVGAKLYSNGGTDSKIDIGNFGEFKETFPTVDVKLERTHASRFRQAPVQTQRSR